MGRNDDLVFDIQGFRGDLEMLVRLVKKKEVDPQQVSLGALMAKKDEGDYITRCSFFFYVEEMCFLKTLKLLPQEEVEEQEDKIDFNPVFQFLELHGVVEDLKLRDAASDAFLRRPGGSWERALPLGLEEVALEDLQEIFKDLLSRFSTPQVLHMQEEEYTVERGIQEILGALQEQEALYFGELFLSASKEKMIALFLSILELIKEGKIGVYAEEGAGWDLISVRTK